MKVPPVDVGGVDISLSSSGSRLVRTMEQMKGKCGQFLTAKIIIPLETSVDNVTTVSHLINIFEELSDVGTNFLLHPQEENSTDLSLLDPIAEVYCEHLRDEQGSFGKYTRCVLDLKRSNVYSASLAMVFLIKSRFIYFSAETWKD